MPALSCFIALLSCICSKFRIGTRNWVWAREAVADFESLIDHRHTNISGLDKLTIESYQKIVIGEGRRLLKPDDNTCPICLSEYMPKETVRIIPECRHCFHAQCIDEWLPLNASCPICRTSPPKLPSQSLDRSWPKCSLFMHKICRLVIEPWLILYGFVGLFTFIYSIIWIWNHQTSINFKRIYVYMISR